MVPFFKAALQVAELPHVTVGVDTHDHVHVAAVIDRVGRELGHASFPTTEAGYARLWRWAAKHGQVTAIGVGAPGCTAPG